MLSNKRTLKIIMGLILSFLWLGCENFEEVDQIPKKQPGTVITDDLSEASLDFDHEGLERMREYLENSTAAFEKSSMLATVLRVMQVGYDWKNGEEDIHSTLKGGRDHTVGKIFQHLVLERFPDEAHLGLIEIIDNPDFLKEIVTYFTTRDLISEEEMTALGQALHDGNIEAIKQAMDKLYLQFIKQYGTYFHTQSEWEKREEDGKTVHVFKKIGWTDRETAFLVERTEMKLQMEGGTITMKEEKTPAQLRIETVELITTLIQKYYGITKIRKGSI